jgi:hypothetical protein
VNIATIIINCVKLKVYYQPTFVFGENLIHKPNPDTMKIEHVSIIGFIITLILFPKECYLQMPGLVCASGFILFTPTVTFPVPATLNFKLCAKGVPSGNFKL